MIPTYPLTPHTSFFTLNPTLLIIHSASFNLQSRLEFDIKETLLVILIFILFLTIWKWFCLIRLFEGNYSIKGCELKKIVSTWLTLGLLKETTNLADISLLIEMLKCKENVDFCKYIIEKFNRPCIATFILFCLFILSMCLVTRKIFFFTIISNYLSRHS